MVSSASQDVTKHQKNTKLSYFLALFASFAWVSGFIYPNEHSIQPFQTNMLKGYPLFIVCFVACQYYGYSVIPKNRKQFILCLVRNTLFVTQDLTSALIQYKLPLPIFHNINQSMAIMIMFLELYFQNKRPNKAQKIGAFFTIVGIFIISNYRSLQKIIRPDYEFSSDFQNYSNSTSGIFFWSIFCLFFVFLISVAIFITNMISFNVYQINFHYACHLILIDAIIYSFFSTNSSASVFYAGFLFSGIIFTLGEFAFVGCILYSENVGVTMLLGSSAVPIGYLYSLFRYNEQISIFSCVGSVAIIYGIYRIMLSDPDVKQLNETPQIQSVQNY